MNVFALDFFGLEDLTWVISSKRFARKLSHCSGGARGI